MSTTTRVTYEQFLEKARRGEFPPDHRIELIEGEIIIMPAPNPPHANVTDELAEWSIQSVPLDRVRVRVQNTVGLPELDSAPAPDLAWVRRRDYSKDHPHAADILLIVEVAESSLPRDRGKKARLYASVGIADYWLVNIKKRCVEARRDPRGTTYQSIETFGRGQEVRPLAFPELALEVSRLFPD